MARSFEGRIAPESANESLIEFRREIQALQEKRKFDATVHDIVVEKLGEAEHEMWLKYKNLLFDITANEDSVHDEAMVKRSIETIDALSAALKSDNLDRAYEHWMRNRYFVLQGNLQCALFRAEKETVEDVRAQQKEIFGELVKEKEEIFG